MTEIMPVPRNLILLSYQQGAFPQTFFDITFDFHLTSRRPSRAIESVFWSEYSRCPPTGMP